jgi:hypothetical protein
MRRSNASRKRQSPNGVLTLQGSVYPIHEVAAPHNTDATPSTPGMNITITPCQVSPDIVSRPFTPDYFPYPGATPVGSWSHWLKGAHLKNPNDVKRWHKGAPLLISAATILGLLVLFSH